MSAEKGLLLTVKSPRGFRIVVLKPEKAATP
jgi:hypothetical protein